MNLLDHIAANELNAELQENAFPQSKSPDRSPDLTLKIIIIGDAEVGKTSTILRYTDDAFKRSYIPTIGVNISPKNIYIKDKWIQLVLWDLAGQAKYNLIRNQFYDGAAGVLFLFDLTYSDSFSNIYKWVQDVKNSVPNFNQLALALCGNKSDLEHQIAISPAQIQHLYRDFQLPYYQISALTGKNINQVFEDLLQKILEQLKF
jgi:small GTP-binding protein